jgi:hypothetical protein
LSCLCISLSYADRRSSLNGNLLIPDRDDVFIYPQLAVKYKNTLSFDYGSTASQGNALFIASIDSKSAFGVALHRSDITNPIGGLIHIINPLELGMIAGAQANVNSANFGGDPASIVDLTYARKMGKKSFGVRLGLSAGGLNNTPKMGDATSNQNFGLRLSAGATLPLGDFVFDFANNSGSVLLKDEDQQTAGLMGIHIGTRLYPLKKKRYKLGVLFDVSHVIQSSEDLINTMTGVNSTSNTTITAAFGPSYKNKEKKIKVAFYGILGTTLTSTDPDDKVDNDDSSAQILILPGFNMAMEYALKEWLVFRSGASYLFNINSSTNAAEDEAGEYGADFSGFGWNAGIGLVFDQLRFDGTFSHGFMNQGPFLLSGAQSNLFALLSATLKY